MPDSVKRALRWIGGAVVLALTVGATAAGWVWWAFCAGASPIC